MTPHNARNLSGSATPHDAAASERRHEKRVQATLKLLVKCTVGDDFVEMRSHDVSIGGLFITSLSPMRLGTLMKIRPSGTTGIEGVGRVVWIRDPDRSAKGAPPGMGIKFIRLSDRSKEEIAQLMAGCAARPADHDGYPHAEEERPTADEELGTTSESGVRPVAPKLRSTDAELETDAVRHESRQLESAVDARTTHEAADAAQPAVVETDSVSDARGVHASSVTEHTHPEADACAVESDVVVQPPADLEADEETRPAIRRARHRSSFKPTSTARDDSPAVDDTTVRPRGVQPAARNAILAAAAAMLALAAVHGAWRAKPAAPRRVQPTASAPSVAAPAPTPAPIFVVVATEPQGAEIFVGDSPQGRAPLTLQMQAGAQVTLRARAPGHVEERIEWTPEHPEESLHLKLTPLPYVLRVDSDPPGAWLVVAGQRARAPADIQLPNFDGKRVALTAGLFGHPDAFQYVSPDQFVEQEDAMRADVKLTFVRGRGNAARTPVPGAAQARSGQPAEREADAADVTSGRE